MNGKRVRRLFRVLPVCLLLPAVLGAAGESPETPDSVRSLLAKYSETQQIISKEREDWKQGKEILLSRIELVRSEIAAAEGRLSEVSAGGSEVRKEKSELTAEIDTLKGVASDLGRWVGEMEDQVRSLHDRLPDPLQEKIRPLFGRMPADSAHSSISVAERFQNIAGILNEANKFNGEINMTSEVRTLSDGMPSEVKVVYVGLAQAYFVGSQGQAGVGRPSEGGWEWKMDDRIAPQVMQVVEVLQNKAKPSFVLLPVDIR